MVSQIEISLSARGRGCHLVTNEILSKLPEINGSGLLHLFIKHTSAALSLNENADPSVREDMNNFLDVLIPENHPVYTHVFEGADDMPAHIKSSLVGSSITIPISKGRLNMGTWQGIYLCEFRDHGSSRRIVATIMT